jgi:hypothetical protein
MNYERIDQTPSHMFLLCSFFKQRTKRERIGILTVLVEITGVTAIEFTDEMVVNERNSLPPVRRTFTHVLKYRLVKKVKNKS